MGDVCPLCHSYQKHKLSKITAQPDMPRSARDWSKMCSDCRRAIAKADSTPGECDWCGSEEHTFRMYSMSGENLRHAETRRELVGVMCGDCTSVSEGSYPAAFSKQKKHARKRDNYECQKCGMPQEDHVNEFGQKLHVHHIDSNKRNNELSNLRTLCARCHGSV